MCHQKSTHTLALNKIWGKRVAIKKRQIHLFKTCCVPQRINVTEWLAIKICSKWQPSASFLSLFAHFTLDLQQFLVLHFLPPPAPWSSSSVNLHRLGHLLTVWQQMYPPAPLPPLLNHPKQCSLPYCSWSGSSSFSTPAYTNFYILPHSRFIPCISPLAWTVPLSSSKWVLQLISPQDPITSIHATSMISEYPMHLCTFEFYGSLIHVIFFSLPSFIPICSIWLRF